jgi:hypothetical protein
LNCKHCLDVLRKTNLEVPHVADNKGAVMSVRKRCFILMLAPALCVGAAVPIDDPGRFAETIVDGCGATGPARDLSSGAGGRTNTVEVYRTASFDVACHLPDRSGDVAGQLAEHEPAIVSYRQAGAAVRTRTPWSGRPFDAGAGAKSPEHELN